MRLATETGDLDVCRALVAEGVDVETALLAACSNGHSSVAEFLLLRGSDPNEKRTSDGASPLLVACEANDLATARVLLRFYRTDVNATNDAGFTALHLTQDLEIVKLLVENGEKVNQCTRRDRVSPLFMAASKNRVSVAESLLSAKADPNVLRNDGASPLLIACDGGHFVMAQLLIKNDANVDACMTDGTTALFVACQKNRTHFVRLLLRHGADFRKSRKNGLSPLMMAAQLDYRHLVKILVDYGADGQRTSPLYVACENNDVNAARDLVRKNFPLDQANDSGATALHVACQKGHLEALDVLINAGCDLSVCDDAGNSPLFDACDNNQIAIVRKLLDQEDIDFNQTNAKGQAPLYAACSQAFVDIARLLLDRGADATLA